MVPVKKAISSTVGKKYIMGLSGLALVIFVILHLLGNLTLLFPDSSVFNAYALKLHDLGALLLVIEIGLVATVLLHMIFAFSVTLTNRKGRGSEKYVMLKTKGGPSHSSIASRNMIITGLVILGFLILHLIQFRFGPGIEQGYVTQLGGRDVRDLSKLVSEVFSNPLNVGIYVFVMAFLGMHLRHGFWSAFQSLGLAYPRISKPIHCLAFLLALVLALGFLVLPIWIYLRH